MRTHAFRLAAAGAILLVACSESPAATTVSNTATVAPTEAPRPSTATSTSIPGPLVLPASRPPPSGVELNSPCMRRAVFGDPAQSAYLLPFPVGTRYRLNQSYCFAQFGHQDQLAYDFVMPIGAEVVSAREGEVVSFREDIPDGELSSENYVHIRHDDGTVTTYAHLQFEGVEVEVGQRVAAGERIGTAGMSGLASDPHLHFAVVDEAGGDVAVNFRNADGPLDLLGGLLRDGVFEALPPDQRIEQATPSGIGRYPGADLRSVDLADAVLWGFNFTGADLSGGGLSGANLAWASLAEATLVGADLSYANLESADLRGADLTGALLTGADLSRTDCRAADLHDADLSGAYVAATDLRGADLRGTDLTRARLIGVKHDDATLWPEGFEPPPSP